VVAAHSLLLLLLLAPGVNGAGKTTQLQIVMGRLSPDSGEVIKAKRNMKVAYLAQVRMCAWGVGVGWGGVGWGVLRAGALGCSHRQSHSRRATFRWLTWLR
jgi:energy-coupling factor transporter ATP-binding protein EcfA2